jgi:hypothetical protein
MANRRWELDRERRHRLVELARASGSDQIIRRILVIDHERTVREAVILESDSYLAARRKLRAVLSSG